MYSHQQTAISAEGAKIPKNNQPHPQIWFSELSSLVTVCKL